MKIYADGASIEQMQALARNKAIRGFTTNPSLMRKAGVKDYASFAARALASLPEYPISFEVLSDDFTKMEEEARKIAAWGDNVYVKIPICNSQGASSGALIRRLSEAGIKVNVTAVLCYAQINTALESLGTSPAVVSIFAGRIADTGRSPSPFVSYALKQRKFTPHEILWASPRQVLDVYLADSLGCDIITCTPELIAKLPLEGKNLEEYSRETVKMFTDDAKSAGFHL